MKTVHGFRALSITILLMCGSTQTTRAQPGDLLVPLPPGYNQIRYNIDGCEDLPNRGRAYCGPAASAILLKWLDENGYPGVAPWGESCCEVTEALLAVGALMSCHHTDGTTSTNMRDGLQGILDDHYPGLFDVGFFGRASPLLYQQQYGRNFASIAAHLNMGHRVVALIGWYDVAWEHFPGKRCSGHYVAVTGYDFVDDSEFWVRFRDPVHLFVDSGRSLLLCPQR